MKTKALTFFAILGLICSCKKDKPENFTRAGSSITTDSNYVDIIPPNKGRVIKMSENGARIMIANHQNDTIHIYNSITGELVSNIVHPGAFNSGFEYIQFSEDGTFVISQQDNYEIKMWDATTGGFIRDLETVFDWVITADNNYILGFYDNLSARTLVKRVNLVTGIATEADTIHEVIFPYIAGTDVSGKYLIIDYEYDPNDPIRPTQFANIQFRDFANHTMLADYTMTTPSYIYRLYATENLEFFTAVTHDSSLSRNYIEFYDVVTGSRHSYTQYIAGFHTGYDFLDAGPGSDRFVSVAEDRLALDHVVFTPTSFTQYSKYSIPDNTHYGFSSVDVNRQGTKVAASYEAIGGVFHVVVWDAWR